MAAAAERIGRKTSQSTYTGFDRRPVGVAGIISPWNRHIGELAARAQIIKRVDLELGGDSPSG
jgi:acyl-CoA reductase-like NAD-dependent aldehyde dehydrogenase